jgi:hypothetical protein
MPDAEQDEARAREEEEKAIEMFKIKKLITSLKKAKGCVGPRRAARTR